MTRRMAEVAKRANVSESTVSRVYNGKPGVAQATREAVLAALDRLDYERPSLLRGERTRLVGLLVPELQNPIFPAFAEAVAGALTQRGLTPVLCTTAAGGMSESAYVEMLLQQQVAGAVFFGGVQGDGDSPHAHFASLLERKLPVVIVNATVEGLGFPSVAADDIAGVEFAFSHLRSLGHERIGIVVGPAGHLPSARKQAAFLRLVSSAGLALDDAVEHAMFSIEGGAAATRLLLDRGVTAAIFASDPLALGGIKEARRGGLSIPRDFSVVGFDDSALMGCTDPPLSTIRQPIGAMGRAAVALLLNQIEAGPKIATELLFEPELVVRASTAAAPRG